MKRGIALGLLLLLCGCNESMDQQNRFKTYGSAELPGWPATGEALPPIAGTIDQDDLDRRRQLATPPPVSVALLERGRARYDIYCAMCHGLAGDGDGIVVARGFPKPKPFSNADLMSAPAPRLVAAIGNGYGVMYPFADRVEPYDRWAIVAYIRALQLAARSKSGAP